MCSSVIGTNHIHYILIMHRRVPTKISFMQILIEIYHFMNADTENNCLCPEENVSFNNGSFFIKFELFKQTNNNKKTFRF